MDEWSYMHSFSVTQESTCSIVLWMDEWMNEWHKNQHVMAQWMDE